MKRPPDRPARRREAGFGILGIVVLIGAMIVAGAGIGVMYVRDLDRQREAQTRRQLQAAFGALFGGPLHTGANMRKDFGYNPTEPATPPGNYSLLGLVRRNAVAQSDPAHAAVPQFDGTIPDAWNGPYYQGSVDGAGRPADGWGRPLQLRYISTTTPPGWQVYSLGANGRDDTGDASPPRGDDLVFPVPPYKLPPLSGPGAPCPTPTINFLRTSGVRPAELVTITLQWAGGSQSQTARFNNGQPDAVHPPVFSNIPRGVAITVTLDSSRRGLLPPVTILLGSGCTASPNPVTF